MAKVLIVEDDFDLREALQEFLQAKKLTVDGVNSITDARSYLAVSDYDALVLDWNLPDGAGVDLLRELRRQGNDTPTIMFTTKSAIDDKIAGFGAGSDDYLCKPFHPEELFLRINSLLQRPKQKQAQQLSAGELLIDLQARIVKKSGQELRLTPKEFALLEFFFRHPNQVFSAEALLERVWTAESESTTETVGATVLRLRKKIDAPGETSRLRNVFGAGYIFDMN